MVIVILGILSSIAIPKIGSMIESSKRAATRNEMQMLKRAIVGNPQVVAGGRYTDLGYEGDVGHLPCSLQHLGRKPAADASYDKFTRRGWNGPYVDTSGGEYLKNAWDTAYVYDSTARTITSTGGDSTLVVTF